MSLVPNSYALMLTSVLKLEMRGVSIAEGDVLALSIRTYNFFSLPPNVLNRL